jgi:hypothetical protein
MPEIGFENKSRIIFMNIPPHFKFLALFHALLFPLCTNFHSLTFFLCWQINFLVSSREIYSNFAKQNYRVITSLCSRVFLSEIIISPRYNHIEKENHRLDLTHKNKNNNKINLFISHEGKKYMFLI